MSQHLPVLSGQEVLKLLYIIGYRFREQEGSHITLRHATRKPLTVPNHREIARGTLRVIIKDAGLTIDEFRKLL
ncbi:MAG: type II toxin-antitoxin system HicA family toxin [Bacteroidetes bacterium]|nr:type II toxin-antitoxin system HicA family toxin [Bacteroidota bacterium]